MVLRIALSIWPLGACNSTGCFSFSFSPFIFIRTQPLSPKMLPTTRSTLYMSMAVSIFCSRMDWSVSSLKDTHRCSLLTILPRFLGEEIKFRLSFEAVWILCSASSSGTKSETAAQRISVDWAGRISLKARMLSRQKQMLVKGSRRILWAHSRNRLLASAIFSRRPSSSPSTASLMESPVVKGIKELSRWKKINGCPSLKISSAIKDPLEPVEKFSIVRTVFFSRGTEVPPEVRKNILFPEPWASMKFLALQRCSCSRAFSFSDILCTALTSFRLLSI